MSDVKKLFRSPTPFSFVDCSTLLSLGLVPLPVSSSPQQVSHDSGISNISGLQGNPGFTFPASCNGLSRPLCRDIPNTHLTSATFLSCRGRFHMAFFLSLTLKSHGQSCQLLMLSETGAWPPCSVTSSPTFCFSVVSFTA